MEDNNQNQGYDEFTNSKALRPLGLVIVCVLSFINAVYQFLVGIFTFLFFDMFKNIFNDESYIELMEKYGAASKEGQNAMEAIFSVNRSYFLLTALLYVVSFIGVRYMWKRLKKGFHIYAIAQILILIVYVLMFCPVTFASPWGDVITTALFISIYYTYYRKEME